MMTFEEWLNDNIHDCSIEVKQIARSAWYAGNSEGENTGYHKAMRTVHQKLSEVNKIIDTI